MFSVNAPLLQSFMQCEYLSEANISSPERMHEHIMQTLIYADIKEIPKM